MKKIALISTFCETKEKLDLLKKNCELMKSLGIDIFIISPIKIDVDADFIFFTKENPILTWPDKTFSAWKTFPYEGKILKFEHMLKDTGWASLYQMKKLMEIAATFEYDLYYLLIYDLKIDEQIISDIKNNLSNTVYQRRDYGNPLQIYPSTFHFTIFDKDKLIEMSKCIQLNEYKENGFAEDFMERWSKKIGLIKSNHIVSDLIHVPIGDVYNLSKDKNYKFFLNKEYGQTLKVFISEFSGIIELKINDYFISIDVDSKLIEVPIKCEDIESIKISFNQNEIDYTKDYINISKNLIYYI